jgi:hypothetical protein
MLINDVHVKTQANQATVTAKRATRRNKSAQHSPASSHVFVPTSSSSRFVLRAIDNNKIICEAPKKESNKSYKKLVCDPFAERDRIANNAGRKDEKSSSSAAKTIAKRV